MKEVRVRFAPSPTGFLHVGGARTAIFNWLFAKNQGGKFLLRIEDTDPERSKSELSAQIIRSMQWLEMNSDEPVVYQSDDIERYKEVAAQLLEAGKAYYAFETAGELTAGRDKAKAAGQSTNYNRASLKLDKETVNKYLKEGREYTVRFLVPEGITEFDDIVHGRTTFRNSEIDDFVILRSDGSPVYQLAVVVDDHDMRISHVIRGDDHLSNTPKQIMLYNALGWEVPLFAHLPMILDEQKKKLSKRRDTVSVEEYKDQGYLPEALFNFLTLLGFAPKDNREIISKHDLIKEFTFDRVNKKSAVFDMNKLNWINSDYIRSTDNEVIADMLREILVRKKILNKKDADALSAEYLISVIVLMKPRVSKVTEIVELGKYFFVEPEDYDENAVAKYWNENIKGIFERYIQVLNSYPEFPDAQKMELNLRFFTDSSEIKAGELIHPLRLALTGSTVSPGIFELMLVLGKEDTIKRLKNFLATN